MCALCENKRFKELANHENKDVLYSSMFFPCIFGQKLIFICVLIIQLCFASLFYKHVLNDMGAYLSKRRKKT
jgi:hypothetical protein